MPIIREGQSTVNGGSARYLRRGDPFRLEGGERAALLLHGFTGSPYEMRALGTALNARGFTVAAPALPGHGLARGNLAGVEAREYLAFVETAYDELAHRHREVALVGMSMGGTLSLHLAAVREPRALVTISTPVFMPDFVVRAVPKLLRWTPRLRVITNISAITGRSVGYPTAPLPAIRAFLDLLDGVRSELAEIKAPLLVVHASRDPTVSAANAAYIAERVGSARRQVKIVNSFWHSLTVPPEVGLIEKDIVDFLAAAA